MTFAQGTLTYFNRFTFMYDQYGASSTFPSTILNIGEIEIFQGVDEVPYLYIENLNWEYPKMFSFGDSFAEISLHNKEIIVNMLQLFDRRPSDICGYLFSADGEIILTRKNNSLFLSKHIPYYYVTNKEGIAKALESIKNNKILFRINNSFKAFKEVYNKNFQLLLLPVVMNILLKRNKDKIVSEEFAYLTFLTICREYGFELPTYESFKWAFKNISPLCFEMDDYQLADLKHTNELKNLNNKQNTSKPVLLIEPKIIENSSTFIPYKLNTIFNGEEKHFKLSDFLDSVEELNFVKPIDCIIDVDTILIGDYDLCIAENDIIFMGIKNNTLYIMLSSFVNIEEYGTKDDLKAILETSFPGIEIKIVTLTN